jgi:hypothetical protein
MARARHNIGRPECSLYSNLTHPSISCKRSGGGRGGLPRTPVKPCVARRDSNSRYREPGRLAAMWPQHSLLPAATMVSESCLRLQDPCSAQRLVFLYVLASSTDTFPNSLCCNVTCRDIVVEGMNQVESDLNLI